VAFARYSRVGLGYGCSELRPVRFEDHFGELFCGSFEHWHRFTLQIFVEECYRVAKKVNRLTTDNRISNLLMIRISFLSRKRGQLIHADICRTNVRRPHTITTTNATPNVIRPVTRGSKKEPLTGNSCHVRFIMAWKMAATKTLLPVLL